MVEAGMLGNKNWSGARMAGDVQAAAPVNVGAL
jgi:hypothetical protein